MATELELKLAVDDLHLLDCILCSADVRSRMQGDFAYVQTESTYFDTPDGKLAEKHWALRLRKLAGKSIVTVKTPGEGLARGEWETEAEYLEDAVPKLVKDEIHAHPRAFAAGRLRVRAGGRHRRAFARGASRAAVRAGAGAEGGRGRADAGLWPGAGGKIRPAGGAAQQIRACAAARTGVRRGT